MIAYRCSAKLSNTSRISGESAARASSIGCKRVGVPLGEQKLPAFRVLRLVEEGGESLPSRRTRNDGFQAP
jgi:hypothetical protein